MADRDKDRERDDGMLDPLELELGGDQGLAPGEPGEETLDLGDLGDMLAGGGGSGNAGGRIVGNGDGDDARGRRRDPYRILVTPISAAISPAVYQRCAAFWAAMPPEQRQAVPMEAQLTQYLEIATFQHALADEQRPAEERQYDWAELHMQGIRPLLEAEMQAARAEIAQDAARGERQTILARISRAATVQEALAMIEEMNANGA